MLAESLEYLAVKPDGRYLDCTAGLAGHTKAIAALLTQGGSLIANDRDAQSLAATRVSRHCQSPTEPRGSASLQGQNVLS